MQVEDGAVEAWQRHMRCGEFERAWAISDRLLESRRLTTCSSLPRHFQWIWDGSRLDRRRVLVRCYHGLGDTIQFVRYVPLVKSIASKVLVWGQPTLLHLLQRVSGIDELLPLHDGVPDCEFDVDVEVMELPHVFRTTLQTIPAAVPYLHARPAIVPRGRRPAVALFWKTGMWDVRRDIPFELLPAFQVTPATLYVIQRDTQPHDPVPPGFNVLYVGDDLIETARLMMALDLIISVDSMPAHLAGALARPVWTLLHSDADWRWMHSREDSPWYPTMRLFRQHRPGDWAPVIQRVVSQLQGLA
jgi:hypothetical protein